jgi:hypothetical protein
LLILRRRILISDRLLGFAWLPFADSTRTVDRGGYGIYSLSELGAVFNSLTGIHTAAEIDYNLNVDTS